MATLTAHSPLYVAPGSHAGMIARGNIDIHARPVVIKQGKVVTSPAMTFRLSNPLFTHEGPDLYARAFAHNRPFAKPGPYQTKLSSAQEKLFRQWLRRWRIPFDPNAKIVDYDMRGYWLSQHGTAEKPAHGLGVHFPDTFKTPYDTTFSRESRYAIKGNPFFWNGDDLIDSRTGQVVFGNVAPRFKHVFVVIPLVIGNRIVGDKEAIANYMHTGAQYGWFDSDQHAKSYAASLHREQARYYKQRTH